MLWGAWLCGSEAALSALPFTVLKGVDGPKPLLVLFLICVSINDWLSQSHREHINCRFQVAHTERMFAAWVVSSCPMAWFYAQLLSFVLSHTTEAYIIKGLSFSHDLWVYNLQASSCCCVSTESFWHPILNGFIYLQGAKFFKKMTLHCI